jgi:hypothetical protein
MNSCTALRASPHSVAMMDQMNTPPAMMARRLWRSDRRAMGRPRKVYNSANASPCSMPIWVSLMCKSRFIGSTSSEIVVRSMNEKMYISIRTATLYHAAKEDGYGDESLLTATAALDCVAI